MKPNPFFRTLLLGLLTVATGRAETFTLESVVAWALARNSDLTAARLTVTEAEGRLEQAGRWANPEFETQLMPNVDSGQGGTYAAGFMQRFPLTARLRHEKEVSRHEVAAAVAEVRDQERRLAFEVRTRAVRLTALNAQRRLKDRQIANTRELATLASRDAGRGEASTIEAARFDLEAVELATQQLRLDSEQAALAGELRPLLGLAAAEPLEFPEALPAITPLPELPGAVAGRPDYVAAVARADAAGAAVSLARTSRWQDLGVGVFGEFERSDYQSLGLQNDGFVGLRLNLPLPLWNRNEGRVKETTAAWQRTQQQAAALARRIEAEAGAARAEMAGAARLAQTLSGTLLPQAVQLEERLRKFHAEGHTSLIDPLHAREKRLELEAFLLDVQRDFALAHARYLAATGTPLPSPAP